MIIFQRQLISSLILVSVISLFEAASLFKIAKGTGTGPMDQGSGLGQRADSHLSDYSN